jgi:hypothetical protein
MWRSGKSITSEVKMKAMKFRLAAGGLICLLVFLTGTATARVYVSVGLGTSFGYHGSHYYGHGYGYPHHRWYGGHRGYYSPWWGHSYWPSHRYSSGSSLWIYPSFTTVYSPSLRVKAPAENPRPKPQISQSMRRHQSELLKVVKIGDKENRISAIRELAPFSFDLKIRAALEDVLLSDPEAEVRKQVATSLGKTENPKVTAALKMAKTKDPDRAVRQAAYRAIIMIEGY